MAVATHVSLHVSLYEKIQNVKTALNTQGIARCGNAFKFKYIGLGDLVPQLEVLCKANRITPIVSFNVDNTSATLTIYDWDSDVMIETTSPVASAKLNNNPSPVQELGAMQTYMRRYLLMSTFNIIENDVLEEEYGKQDESKGNKVGNKTNGKMDIKQQHQSPKLITEAQIMALKAYGIDDAKLQEMATYFKVKTINEIPFEKAERQLKSLEGKMGAKKDVLPPVQDDNVTYYDDIQEQGDFE